MAKNSTLFSNVSFVSLNENLKGKSFRDNQFAPNDAVISNILSFSRALKIEKSHHTGLIQMVLN